MNVSVQRKQRAPAIGEGDSPQSSGSQNPLGELHPSLRPSDEEFLNRSESLGLTREKWEKRLLAWGEQLHGFGNSTKFLSELSVAKVRLPNSNEHGTEAAAHQFTFDGRNPEFKRLLLEDRAALRRQGVVLAEYSPEYASAQHESDTATAFLDQFNACGCCQTVARARMLDRTLSTPYAVTVNAFPWDPLNEMQSALLHDSMADRVMINEKGIYVPKVGKTIGSIFAPTWIESVMQNANRREAVAIQNHPASGMSAAKHLHAQFFPRDLNKAEILRQVIDDFGPADSDRVVARRSRFHPFDTLVLSCSDTAALSKVVAALYCRLEHAHMVSTLAYLDGHCFLSLQSPKPNGYLANDFGARVLLNYYRPEEIKEWAAVEETFYKPGDAPWEHFHLGAAA